ncbi:hypothetical protein NDU88_007938 [Pleurodeles waltl]|uniref:C2H2-type domain-containing protein n=1 Tax=Pleurodeles waltl TaxID=8319 RepID=A0AAV7PN32_PLEWA|nr:hypothetical protein NDU88_007938 [Pleurodeles waltl]
MQPQNRGVSPQSLVNCISAGRPLAHPGAPNTASGSLAHLRHRICIWLRGSVGGRLLSRNTALLRATALCDSLPHSKCVVPASAGPGVPIQDGVFICCTCLLGVGQRLQTHRRQHCSPPALPIVLCGRLSHKQSPVSVFRVPLPDVAGPGGLDCSPGPREAVGFKIRAQGSCCLPHVTVLPPSRESCVDRPDDLGCNIRAWSSSPKLPIGHLATHAPSQTFLSGAVKPVLT